MKVAICSPSRYSTETFIRSHIDGIQADVTYYYGDVVPRRIEGEGLFSIDRSSLSIKNLFRVGMRINPIELKKSNLSILEYLLARSLQRHKIDVVLAEYGTTGASILDACKWANIPLVTHFHGRDVSATEVIKTYHKKYTELFRYCDSIISVSSTMTDKLKGLGCPSDKIVYAPCCPDVSFSEIEPNIQSRCFVSIGRLTEKKAPYALLFSFKRALNHDNNFRLIIAGDGPLLGSCINIAKILGIENNVSFPGDIGHDQVAEMLKNCRAYVQHSITAYDGDMEGTPVAIMEAQAAGLPVISTKHAGIQDVVINNTTGLLCEELDIDSMAENMITLMNDTSKAIQMGKRGKERIASEFSKEWQMEVLTSTLKKASIK